MAKHSTIKASGPARVRLVVLDAEIPDGDLNSLTHALQNALRSPTTTVVQRGANTNGSKGIAHQPEADLEAGEVVEEAENPEPIESTPRPAKSRVSKKSPKAPDVVDIEMNEGVSFALFANGKSNDSWHKKFLIAAAWLHEHRNIAAVTDDHIYTCFRSIGWPTNLEDFSQPLRELKFRRFFTTPERGHYAINHLGLDAVKKLGGDDGAA